MDTVLNWLWQGSVVAIALTLLLRLLTRARAQVRFLVCWAALLLVCLLPLVFPLLTLTGPGLQAEAVPGPVVFVPGDWWTVTGLFAGVWMLWVGLSVARLAGAMITLRRARRRMRGVPAAIQQALPHWTDLRRQGRPAALAMSDRVRAAAVLGCGAPVIAVAPALVRRLDTAELDRVIVHEWAHVQRRDDLTNALQLAIRAIAGWHPAIWWIDRRLQLERELACDEMAVAITGSPKAYAACLVKLAAWSPGRRELLPVPGIAASPGLRARITRLLSRRDFMPLRRSFGVAASIVTALTALAAAASGMPLVGVTAGVPDRFEAPNASVVHALVTTEPATAARRTVVTPPVAAPGPAVDGRDTASLLDIDMISSVQSARAPVVPAPESDSSVEPAADPTTGAIGPSRPPMPLEGAPIASATLTAAPDIASDADEARTRAPWDHTAAAGVQLGRGAKDAGVATAGFFTRFATRVAGAF